MSEVHLCKFYTQKYGFQVKFQTQKQDTHTLVCKHGKYPPPPGIIISNLAGLYCTSGVRVSFIRPIVDTCKSVKGESYTVTLEFPMATKVYSQVYSKMGRIYIPVQQGLTTSHNESELSHNKSKLHYNRSQRVKNCITTSHNKSKLHYKQSQRVKNE